mmetsp:Transcript_33414/g.53529  ORF Transcript_33414/g.53529 Transcript_33414/m.53529 type:complete len:396 (+) Transcript_33414:41-1228(+)
MQRIRRLSSHIMASSQSIKASKPSLLCTQRQALSSQSTANKDEQKYNEERSVLIEEFSGNFLVTLNRAKALNSLNIDMINILTPFYEQLVSQKKQCTVVMRGAGGKAFCAGGDVRHLYDLGISGAKIEEITEFFKLEYNLDHLLGTLPDYVHNVCILNGITMGGGVGISVHGRYRIATNNTLFAMPETGIGFYTDVGGSFFLPRLVPPGLGLYLGLNGHRLKGCDVLHAGIATHYVDQEQIDALTQDLLNGEPGVSTPAILGKYAMHPSKLIPFTMAGDMDTIAEIFDMEKNKSVEEIVYALETLNNDFASNTLKQLLAVSPTSLKVVYRALMEGRNKTLRECLDMEFDIVTEFMRQHDFYEGIRAQLVDKDRNPKWNPQSLDKVASIDSYFPNV